VNEVIDLGGAVALRARGPKQVGAHGERNSERASSRTWRPSRRKREEGRLPHRVFDARASLLGEMLAGQPLIRGKTDAATLKAQCAACDVVAPVEGSTHEPAQRRHTR